MLRRMLFLFALAGVFLAILSYMSVPDEKAVQPLMEQLDRNSELQDEASQELLDRAQDQLKQIEDMREDAKELRKDMERIRNLLDQYERGTLKSA